MDDPDYEELVDRIRTHSSDAPGSDTERVTIRTLESADPDALGELRAAIDEEAIESADLTYVLSRSTASSVRDGGAGADGDHADALEERLGTPIRVADGMPDDAVLLLDPDAVADGELRSPSAIALGTLKQADT
ncbi:hypothetical protein [Halovivax limisalsi]|uniref:hypothetical protein n=1 Tax=Halovivax limisalsi TaxID=1453760 RepID=UPI001FFDA236|nr:hypothetical protein [Halovivax limisalsi]